MAGPCPPPGAQERAGSCWQDPLAEALSRGPPIAPPPGRGCARSRPLSLLYVLTREPQPGLERDGAAEAEPLPLRCLREACAQLAGPRPRPQLRTLPFGTLALGDTAALDSFYNAGERAGRRGRGGARAGGAWLGGCGAGRDAARSGLHRELQLRGWGGAPRKVRFRGCAARPGSG